VGMEFAWIGRNAVETVYTAIYTNNPGNSNNYGIFIQYEKFMAYLERKT
jgi:hypothetical protein